MEVAVAVVAFVVVILSRPEFPGWDGNGIGFLALVPDRPGQELCAKRGKNGTLPDAVRESLRGKVPFRD